MSHYCLSQPIITLRLTCEDPAANNPYYYRPWADTVRTVALNLFFVHNEHAVGLNHSPEKDCTGYSSTDILGIRWTNQYPTALPRQTDKDSDYIWQLTGMPYNTAYNAPSADVDERLRVLTCSLPNSWPVEASSFSGDYDVRYFLFVLDRRLQAHNTVQPTETPASCEYRLKSQTCLQNFKAQIEKTLLETYGAVVVQPADAETPAQYTLTFQRKIQAGAFLMPTLSSTLHHKEILCQFCSLLASSPTLRYWLCCSVPLPPRMP